MSVGEVNGDGLKWYVGKHGVNLLGLLRKGKTFAVHTS